MNTVRSLLAVCAVTVLASSADATPPTILHVDCAATVAGDGTARAPFRRVVDAVSAGRLLALPAGERLIIHVRPGTCAEEAPLPILLDFPVWLRGSRVPAFDADGFPTAAQENDTLILASTTTTVPTMIRITGPEVRVSHLSLDGLLPNSATPRGGTLAVLVERGEGFALHELRIVRTIGGINTTSASGAITSNYLGELSSGIVVRGGADPASVLVRGNRVENHSAGAMLVGGIGVDGGALVATVTDNDFVTSWTGTGPSNPYGIRVQPISPPNNIAHAETTATVARNRVRGTHYFPLIFNSGQSFRDRLPWSARVDVDLIDNVIEGTRLVTFTNSRMTQLPCELDPTSVRGPDCPNLQPGQHYTYLIDSTFTIDHTGELDGALIDHPALHPYDGTELGNTLVINGEPVEHQPLIQLP